MACERSLTLIHSCNMLLHCVKGHFIFETDRTLCVHLCTLTCINSTMNHVFTFSCIIRLACRWAPFTPVPSIFRVRRFSSHFHAVCSMWFKLPPLDLYRCLMWCYFSVLALRGLKQEFIVTNVLKEPVVLITTFPTDVVSLRCLLDNRSVWRCQLNCEQTKICLPLHVHYILQKALCWCLSDSHK